MRIFERAVVLGVFALTCIRVVASCLAPGNCLRNSDCDSNLACSAGKCVRASDAGDVQDADAAPTSSAMESSVASPMAPADVDGVPALLDVSSATDGDIDSAADDAGGQD